MWEWLDPSLLYDTSEFVPEDFWFEPGDWSTPPDVTQPFSFDPGDWEASAPDGGGAPWSPDIGDFEAPDMQPGQFIPDATVQQWAQEIETAVRSGDPSVLARVNQFLSTPFGRIVGMATLGGAGIAAGQLATGGSSSPSSVAANAPLSPTAQAGQAAVMQGLGGGTPNSLATAMFGPDAVPYVGSSGSQDLADMVRLGVGGYRSLAELANLQAIEALGTNVAQLPYLNALRMGATGEIPGFMGPWEPDPTASRLLSAANTALDQGPGTYYDPFSDALRQIAGNIMTEGPGTMTDPVRDALGEQVMRVLSGQWSNPELEARIATEEQTLRNRLSQQLGVDPDNVELSTPGAQAMADFRRQADALREQDKRAIVAAYEPPERARSQYALEFPQTTYQRNLATFLPEERARGQFGSEFPQATYQRNLATYLPATLGREQFGEQTRQTGLGERLMLSQFGVPSASQVGSSLTSYLPTSPLLGFQESAADAAYRRSLSLADYQNQQQQDRDLAQSLGSLGALAGVYGLGLGRSNPNQTAGFTG